MPTLIPKPPGFLLPLLRATVCAAHCARMLAAPEPTAFARTTLHRTCLFQRPTRPHLHCFAARLPAAASQPASLTASLPLSLPAPPLACVVVRVAGEPAGARICRRLRRPSLPPPPSHHLRCVRAAETSTGRAGTVKLKLWLLCRIAAA